MQKYLLQECKYFCMLFFFSPRRKKKERRKRKILYSSCVFLENKRGEFVKKDKYGSRYVYNIQG